MFELRFATKIIGRRWCRGSGGGWERKGEDWRGMARMREERLGWERNGKIGKEMVRLGEEWLGWERNC